MTEASAEILQTIIGEFKNLSPDTKNTFLFKTDGKIMACDETTSEEQSKNLIAAFNGISSKAGVIEGVDTLVIQGSDSQLNIISMNNKYLATVSSRKADEKIIKSLTRVIVPAFVNLADETSKTLENNLDQTPLAEEPEEPKKELDESETLAVQEPSNIEATNDEPPEIFSSEPLLPQPPVTQLLVEKIGGLLVASDSVRINSEIISKWVNLYGVNQISEVHIETLEGKETTCKFRAVKEANTSSQGIIQIPEKILQILQASKGKLVIVKPVLPAMR